MVKLPPQFVATKYPGYFWNVQDQKLYSLKVSGILTTLTRIRPSRWNQYREGYRVSVRGRDRLLTMQYLEGLLPGSNSTIPVAKK